MRKYLWVVVGIAIFAASAAAQDTPKAELFGGYSFLRVSGGGASTNFNGGSASLAGNFNSWFGIVSDFGAYHANQSGVSGTLFSYTFGPRISFRSTSSVTPFAQVLLGGAHLSVGLGGVSGGVNSFVGAAGGGVDVKASDHIAIRVVQAEYVFSHFAGQRQNNARISAGIVFRFGRK